MVMAEGGLSCKLEACAARSGYAYRHRKSRRTTSAPVPSGRFEDRMQLDRDLLQALGELVQSSPSRLEAVEFLRVLAGRDQAGSRGSLSAASNKVEAMSVQLQEHEQAILELEKELEDHKNRLDVLEQVFIHVDIPALSRAIEGGKEAGPDKKLQTIKLLDHK